MTRVALIGATGRMGTAIVRASVADETLAIIAAVASAGSKSTGRDVGVVAGIKALGLPVIDELPPDLAHAEVAIDFSRPELSLRVLQVCRAARVPIVIGTTGHGAEFATHIAAASRDIAVLVAPNTSIGVAVAQELVRIASAALPAEFDIEIAEAHHKHKLDAPRARRSHWPTAPPRRVAWTPRPIPWPDVRGKAPGAAARLASPPCGRGISWVPIQCFSPVLGSA